MYGNNVTWIIHFVYVCCEYITAGYLGCSAPPRLRFRPWLRWLWLGYGCRCALRWIPVCLPLRCCDPRSTICSFRGRSRTWTLDKLAPLIISNVLSGCSTVCICNPYRIRHVRVRFFILYSLPFNQLFPDSNTHSQPDN